MPQAGNLSGHTDALARYLHYRILPLGSSQLTVLIEIPPWTVINSAADVETEIDQKEINIRWSHYPESDTSARLVQVGTS
jgi:hypothetical protein